VAWAKQTCSFSCARANVYAYVTVFPTKDNIRISRLVLIMFVLILYLCCDANDRVFPGAKESEVQRLCGKTRVYSTSKLFWTRLLMDGNVHTRLSSNLTEEGMMTKTRRNRGEK